jgi:hypothetical protein
MKRVDLNKQLSHFDSDLVLYTGVCLGTLAGVVATNMYYYFTSDTPSTPRLLTSKTIHIVNSCRANHVSDHELPVDTSTDQEHLNHESAIYASVDPEHLDHELPVDGSVDPERLDHELPVDGSVDPERLDHELPVDGSTETFKKQNDYLTSMRFFAQHPKKIDGPNTQEEQLKLLRLIKRHSEEK